MLIKFKRKIKSLSHILWLILLITIIILVTNFHQINKNSQYGNLKKTAKITMLEYKNAQKMISNIREDISPEVFLCSSTESIGITKIWNFIKKFEKIRKSRTLAIFIF